MPAGGCRPAIAAFNDGLKSELAMVPASIHRRFTGATEGATGCGLRNLHAEIRFYFQIVVNVLRLAGAAGRIRDF